MNPKVYANRIKKHKYKYNYDKYSKSNYNTTEIDTDEPKREHLKQYLGKKIKCVGTIKHIRDDLFLLLDVINEDYPDIDFVEHCWVKSTKMAKNYPKIDNLCLFNARVKLYKSSGNITKFTLAIITDIIKLEES